MLVISRPDRVPHGGRWRYNANGHELAHPYLNVLQTQVQKYCAANKLKFDLTEFVQNVCATTTAEINRRGVHQQICHDADEREPNVKQIVSGFVRSMTSWAKSGFAMADQNLLEQRLAKCRGCEHWNGSTGGTLMSGRCKLCGCRGIKLALATSHCPKGLWAVIIFFNLCLFCL